MLNPLLKCSYVIRSSFRPSIANFLLLLIPAESTLVSEAECGVCTESYDETSISTQDQNRHTATCNATNQPSISPPLHTETESQEYAQPHVAHATRPIETMRNVAYVTHTSRPIETVRNPAYVTHSSRPIEPS